MRRNLARHKGERKTFFAAFERFGAKPAFKGDPIKTALFVDVIDADGNAMCDHLWFTVGKRMESLALEEGDTIRFDARVTPYVKGYMGRRPDVYVPLETDYRLSFPTKFALIRHRTDAEKQAIEAERLREQIEWNRQQEQARRDAVLRPEMEPVIARLADALMKVDTKEARRAIWRSPEYASLTHAERNRAERLRHQHVLQARRSERKRQQGASNTPSAAPKE